MCRAFLLRRETRLIIIPRVVMISVAQAKSLVRRRRATARRNPQAVEAYAMAMRENRWVLNGIPIIISTDGALCDGYHRLLACIEAQTPFLTLIIHDGGHEAGDAIIECEPPVTSQCEAIDAGIAREYLSFSTRSNILSQTRITVLAADLSNGRQIFDSQPICFAQNGSLLNGRHRLHALITAGGTGWAVVIRGLPDEAAGTYDTHAGRARGSPEQDVFGDLPLAAAMANLLWRHELKTLAITRAKATPGEIKQIIAAHPRLLGLRSFARRLNHAGRASVMGYAAYVMERDDPVLAAQFLAILETDDTRQQGHPAAKLRVTLLALHRRKASQERQLATMLEGWARFKLWQSKRMT